MIFFILYLCSSSLFSFFFFNDTATTEIYTLSLHDALPICVSKATGCCSMPSRSALWRRRISCWSPAELHKGTRRPRADRKSTRLNSSHLVISYAVFCLKKKKNNPNLRIGWQCEL